MNDPLTRVDGIELPTGALSAPKASADSCATCRYVGTHKRPRIMEETGFGDQLMFDDADKDETVYTCRAFMAYATLGDRIGPTRVVNEEELERGDADGIQLAVTFATHVVGSRALCEHAGKEIGLVPIVCEAWAACDPPTKKSARLEELDRKIAERESRMAAKEGK